MIRHHDLCAEVPVIELIKQHIHSAHGRRHRVIDVDRRTGTVEAFLLAVADEFTLRQTLREGCDLLHGLAHLRRVVLCLENICAVLIEVRSGILGIEPRHRRKL